MNFARSLSVSHPRFGTALRRHCPGPAQALLGGVLFFALCAAAGAQAGSPQAPSPGKSGTELPSRKPGLQNCIEVALENNRKRPASKLAVEIAQAQHLQALSSYWPQLKFQATLSRLDRDPVSVKEPYTDSYLSWNELAPLWTTSVAQIGPVRTKLRDRDNIDASLTLTYPVFTGGKGPAVVAQAKAGLEAVRQEARRTDLEVVYDVTKMYYGALLARNVLKLGQEALSRLEATLELTETLYKKGSGRVKKTDYLRNKIMVETARSLTARLAGNEKTALAALVNSMGLHWSAPIELPEQEIPFVPYEADLGKLVGDSYEFNPDWARLQRGLEAAQAGVRDARSGYWPKAAVFGSLNRTFNSYDYGIATDDMKKTWAIGFAVDFPVFDGFLTAGRLKEALARLKKLEQEKILLREGLALQVKHAFLQLAGAKEQEKASREAVAAAQENRELNIRAYQDELVETKDVIEAQLLESFIKAQYQKIIYDHAEAKARLAYVVGEEIGGLLLR